MQLNVCRTYKILRFHTSEADKEEMHSPFPEQGCPPGTGLGQGMDVVQDALRA